MTNFIEKWNVYTSLQGNDDTAPISSIEIVAPTEKVCKKMFKNGVFEFFNSINDKKILVVGAGHGAEVYNFIKNDYDTSGIILHESDKKFAKEHFNIDLILEDMHNMSFEHDIFDGVYTRHTLEHSISPLISLFEIRRVLKPNGKLFLIVPPDELSSYGIQHYFVLRKEHWIHLLDILGFDIIYAEEDDDIIIKAFKTNKECPGKHFEKELIAQNIY